MNWLLLLVLMLIAQAILILWRPRGWSSLVLALLSMQWITACLVSAAVVPMIASAMLTTWDEWQERRHSSGMAEDTSLNLEPIGVLPYRKGEGGELSTPYLHGPIAAWQGVDYARPCGMELVAPADMIVEGIGTDDGRGNTSIVLRFVHDPGLKLGLVHGNYVVGLGDYLGVGHLIGYTDSLGVSTGCHDHIVLWRDGVPISIVDFVRRDEVIADKPLMMSWYNPDLAGINCDSDCTVTASGELVEDWWGAGAACIPEWMGRDIEIEGRKWKCIDTGGGIVETDGWIWVDLLTKNSKYAYGQLVTDWRFADG